MTTLRLANSAAAQLLPMSAGSSASPSDPLAERLRRRPAKPMGSPRVGSNPTGVDVRTLRGKLIPERLLSTAEPVCSPQQNSVENQPSLRPRNHGAVSRRIGPCVLNCADVTLAERLRRRPAKPMGSPRVGSNLTGVACMHCCGAFLLPRSMGVRAVRREEKPFFDHAAACHYCRCPATAYVSLQLSSSI